MSSALHEKLAGITLLDANGKSVTLGTLWARPLVLAHLRHFGCLYCRQRLSELKAAVPKIAALGGHVVAIGTGDVPYAAQLTRELQLPFPLLSDELLESYRAVGAHEKNLITWASPTNLMAMARSMQLGYRQAKAGKHQSTLGATHVLFPDRVTLAWVNEDFSRDAPVARVLDALEDL